MATKNWINLSEDDGCRLPLICWNRDQKALYVLETHEISKYSSDKNAWVKCRDILLKQEEITNTGIFSYPYATVDSAGDTIFAYDCHGSILIMDINEVHPKYVAIDDVIRTGMGAQGIMINNEFHVIGGYRNNKHLKWNETIRKFEKLHDLRKAINWNGIGRHSMVKIKHKLLVFGGYDKHQHQYINNIYEYDIKANKWSSMSIQLPTERCNMGCISVLNDQYILILGGDDFTHGPCDDIWIYSVAKRIFKKSPVKCPQKASYQAFVVGDKRKDQMAVFGYVRIEWFKSQMEDHLFPPEYLIRIMGRYYLNEEIHLFGCISGSVHWKINVFDIVT